MHFSAATRYSRPHLCCDDHSRDSKRLCCILLGAVHTPYHGAWCGAPLELALRWCYRCRLIRTLGLLATASPLPHALMPSLRGACGMLAPGCRGLCIYKGPHQCLDRSVELTDHNTYNIVRGQAVHTPHLKLPEILFLLGRQHALRIPHGRETLNQLQRRQITNQHFLCASSLQRTRMNAE